MTRCPECSQASGVDVDHTPDYTLPPLLARFEHFVATKGILGEPQGAIDKDLPTRGKRVPSKEMSAKHRVSCLATLLHGLTEMGFLQKGEGAGRWTFPTHPNLRDLSARQIQDYILRRFPRDPCRTHDARCVRCCLPHHLSMYNKTCEAFRKMAEWFYFEERFRDEPAWSKEKLIDVYAVARSRRYKRGSHEINPVELVLAFRDWLETKAVAPWRGPAENFSGQRRKTYERALGLFESKYNAKEIAKRLGIPYSTAYYWCVKGRVRSAVYERVRAEMPRAYGFELWWLQETGSRYEEMVHAEFPLVGPFVTLNRGSGLLTIVGKGREGGKVRTVTLTKDQAAKVEEILKWRAQLGKVLREYTGRDPEPALFVTLADARKKSGGRLAENSGRWNTTLRAWAARYNAWCKANGRDAATIDPAFVTSHRIGRAVSITKLVKEGVAEKVVMLERGIEDHRTLEGYIHTTSEERREILERAEQSRLARQAAPNRHDPAAADGSEDLRRQLAAAEERARRAEDRADRLERKIDELIAKLEPRAIA
jgi:hypothetical protein